MAESQVRSRVAALVAAHGTTHVARMLGLSREAVLRLAASAPVRPGTVAQAAARIMAIASTPAVQA